MSELPMIAGADQSAMNFVGPELTTITFGDTGAIPVIRAHQSIVNLITLEDTGEDLIALALRLDDTALGYFMDADLARNLAAQLLKGADMIVARRSLS